jgi:hypothetical protein
MARRKVSPGREACLVQRLVYAVLADLEALLRGDFVGFTADDRLKKHVRMMDYTRIGETTRGNMRVKTEGVLSSEGEGKQERER